MNVSLGQVKPTLWESKQYFVNAIHWRRRKSVIFVFVLRNGHIVRSAFAYRNRQIKNKHIQGTDDSPYRVGCLFVYM